MDERVILILERYAWQAEILPGKEREYRKRHDEIWPELVAVLKDAGIQNYSIWQNGRTLFGYYECRKGAEFAARVQAENPVVDRWNEFMKDVMLMRMDPVTGAQPRLVEVFYLGENRFIFYFLPPQAAEWSLLWQC